MADKPKSPGFPQKYTEAVGDTQQLDPAAVVDLVTPQEASRVARANLKPARASRKVAKPAKRGRKPKK